jgi:hypothetical protein
MWALISKPLVPEDSLEQALMNFEDDQVSRVQLTVPVLDASQISTNSLTVIGDTNLQDTVIDGTLLVTNDTTLNNNFRVSGNARFDTNIILSNVLGEQVIFQIPSSSVTDYTVTFPSSQGNNNTVLVNDGSGNLSWKHTQFNQSLDTTDDVIFDSITSINDLIINTDTFVVDTSTNRVGINNLLPAEELDIVGDILLQGNLQLNSGSGIVTFQSNPITTNYSLTFPSTQGSINQVLINDGTGILSWNNSNSISDGDGDTIIEVDRGIVDNDIIYLKAGGLDRIIITGLTGDINFSIGSKIIVNDVTNSISINTGALIIKGGVGINNDIFIGGNVDITNNLLLTGNIEHRGTTSGSITYSVPSTITSYNLTWPNAVATISGQVLSSDLSGNLSWETPTAVSGGTLIADTTGSDTKIETEATVDTLTFTTAGTERMTIGSTGILNTSVGTQILVNDVTTSSSTTTGSLIISGGVGIQDNLYINGIFNTENDIIMNGTISGNITHSVPSTIVSYNLTWPNAIATIAGQVLTSDLGGNLSWETPTAASGGTFIADTTGADTKIETEAILDTLTFTTSGIQRMIIEPNGLIGINLDNPLSTLNIKQISTEDLFIVEDQNNTEYFKINTDGHLSGTDMALKYKIDIISTTNATLNDTHKFILCDNNTATININLPNVNECPGKIYIISNISSEPTQNVVIISNGTNTIEGNDTFTLENIHSKIHIVSNGIDRWYIL